MKRSVWAVIISATVYAALAASSASCTWMPEVESGNKDDARLVFRFTRTKADSALDTSQFILKVLQSGTDAPVYEGLYGDRPAELTVPAGTYTVSVQSCRFDAPTFDAPLYGDEKVVIARSGETLAVSFLCTLRNSGVRFDFSEQFRARYPGKLVLRQDGGALDFGYDEQRTAWLRPGETRFCYSDGQAENVLFRRNLEAGQIRLFRLDATTNEAGSVFSIALDTTATRLEERIVIGEDSGGDGLSMATAYSVAELAAADCAGDTVWVWGYIVGAILAEKTVDFDCDTVSAGNNLAIAASPDVRDPAACAGINLTKAAHKAALSLGDPAIKAAIFHRKIYVQGKATTYKKFPAITNLCDYQLE